jgi:protein TonB
MHSAVSMTILLLTRSMLGNRMWPPRLVPITVVIAVHALLILALARMNPMVRKLDEPVRVSLIVPSPQSEQPKAPEPPRIVERPKLSSVFRPRAAAPAPLAEESPTAVSAEPLAAPVATSEPPADVPAQRGAPMIAPVPVAAAKVPGPIVPPRFDAAYLNNPDPEYPRLARRLGEQGKVLLRVYVSVTGAAEQVEIRTSSGSPRLDAAAKAAVERWRFVPARQGDEPIAAWVEVPISFVLTG